MIRDDLSKGSLGATFEPQVEFPRRGRNTRRSEASSGDESSTVSGVLRSEERRKGHVGSKLLASCFFISENAANWSRLSAVRLAARDRNVSSTRDSCRVEFSR